MEFLLKETRSGAVYIPKEVTQIKEVWVAVISAKNHKRQRRKRNRQTRKVANAKGLNRNTNLA